ncbi:MAG: sigma-E factor negative regulatory protein [Pseudomonadales bacterium]
MTEKLRQSLSAAIDDEADEFELRRVLDELDDDPELRALWDRYHVIGSALRGEQVSLRKALAAGSLRESVWEALDGVAADDDGLAAEPFPAASASVAAAAAPVAGGRRLRLGRYTGLAVAASVAFAVVLGSSLLSFDSDSPTPALAGAELGAELDERVAPLSTPAFSSVRTPGAPGTIVSRNQLGAEVSASDMQRAHAYMLHHTQQQALNQTGVMSIVKLATYEAP